MVRQVAQSDKHYTRKSADRKAEISKELVRSSFRSVDWFVRCDLQIF